MRRILVAIPLLLLPAFAPSEVTFTDVTKQAGIRFVHNNGAFGKKYLPETMGSGVAFLDYDNDGWLDIFLVNCSDWPGRKTRKSFPALYRNTGQGTFRNVTRQAGLEVEFYGMGVAAADYDNDGDADLYLSGIGPDHLFQNQGNGRFTNVTKASGLHNPDFGTSASWFDYDKDGKLDLFVANYVKWDRETDIFCTLDGTNKSYCTPESYQGSTPRLYRNLGNGKFAEVTRKAGLYDESNKGLGVLIFDYNQDTWLDIMLANDTQPNKLWENNTNGTFTEVGILAGVAFSEDGVARGAMGIDAGDYDNSGHPSVVIGNFSNEMIALYHNEGTGFFIDEAPTSTVGPSSLLTLAFACFFFDYNLDGFLDIYTGNGHVENEINLVQEKVTYAQPPHLFQNQDGRSFKEVTRRMGTAFAQPRVARGSAYGDFDNDGDLDIVVNTGGGPAALFRNDGGNRNNWVTLVLSGTKSNRSGIGAVAKLTADGFQRSSLLKSGGSYCSESQLRMTFGLGRAQQVERLEILWPSGKNQVLAQVPINQVLRVDEDRGLLSP